MDYIYMLFRLIDNMSAELRQSFLEYVNNQHRAVTEWIQGSSAYYRPESITPRDILNNTEFEQAVKYSNFIHRLIENYKPSI